MLGKPVICYINRNEVVGDELKLWQECPIVSATESTVYEKLKILVKNKTLRREIGQKSREYALKWHSSDACAERYEMIYDALNRGERDFTTITQSERWNSITGAD